MSDAIDDTAPPEAAAPAPKDWHPIARVLFRFGFLYFALYVLQESLSFAAQFVQQVALGWSTEPEDPTATEAPPEWIGWVAKPAAWVNEGWDRVVRWAGEHIPGVKVTVGPLGSGDTTWNYVQIGLLVALAIVGCVVWSAAAEALRNRRHTHVAAVGRVWCRYYLVAFFLVYGFIKVIKTQFPFPNLMRLTERFGDSSPMGILWAMMGYSTPYNMFTGGGEVLAGVLLAFRRTTMLGALVGLGVMANVAALNFCFDVPVKLFSSHLALFCVALLVRDARRLLDFFVLDRRTEPALARRPGWPVTLLECAVLGVLVWSNVQGGLDTAKKYGDAAEKPPLYGLYDVVELTRDGQPVPLLVTDAQCWKQVMIEGGSRSALFVPRRMNEQLEYYRAVIDTAAHGIKLSAGSPEAPKESLFAYIESEPDGLAIEGELNGVKLAVKLKRRDLNEFTLVSRGYHWINEYPFNK